MRQKSAIGLLFILFLFMEACFPPVGEFGFAVKKDIDPDPLNSYTNNINEYKMMRDNLVFSPQDRIYYIYTIQTSLFSLSQPVNSGTEFIVGLDVEQLGFVEVELKKKRLDSSSHSLKDYFQFLEPGNYQLKVAFDQEVIDSVRFKVVPDNGYALAVDSEDSTEVDDIIRYSK